MQQPGFQHVLVTVHSFQRGMQHPFQLERPITFFDLETTSATIDTARIVEIAMIRLEPGDHTERFQSRVNPGVPIEPGATKVHGISDEDLQGEPSFKEIAARVASLVEGADLGGFNATSFDAPILHNELRRAGYADGLDGTAPVGRVLVDAYDLECALNLRTLESLYARYTGKPLEGSHAAHADVGATLDVLSAQLSMHDIQKPTPAQLQQLARGDYLDAKRRFLQRDDGEVEVCFGKHKGKTLRDMLTFHADYVAWMCREMDTEIRDIVAAQRLQH